jgi:parallel beta-helix repeat protein
MKKLYSVVLVSAVMILFLILVSSIASASTLYVGGTGNYMTIQSAVDHAKPADTIIVNSGTYPETVNLTTQRLTIIGKNYPKVNGFTGYHDGGSGIGAAVENINGFSIIKTGISLSGDYGGNDIIRNNYFYNCGVDIEGESSGNDVVMNNQLLGGTIKVYGPNVNDVKITGNKISNSKVGIYVNVDSKGGQISGNTITGCNIGIEYSRSIEFGSTSPYDEVYNNYFNNNVNVQFDFPGGSVFSNGGDAVASGYTIWNITKILGTNLIGGPYTAGNFWASPNGKGYSQTAVDSNGDGIADFPYVIDRWDIDYLPLVPLKPPVASFVMSKSSGKSPLAVYFTDKSTGTIISEKWIFGDGATSTLKNPSHKFTKVGKWKVTLTVTNKAGSSSKYQYVAVTK